MVSSSHDIAATVSLGWLQKDAQRENDDVSLGRLQKAKGHFQESRGSFFIILAGAKSVPYRYSTSFFILLAGAKSVPYRYFALLRIRRFSRLMTSNCCCHLLPLPTRTHRPTRYNTARRRACPRGCTTLHTSSSTHR